MPPPRVIKNPRNERTTKGDVGYLRPPVKFLDQDYQELYQNCQIDKKRYVDEKFPPDRSSIDPWKKLQLNQERIKWLRPSVSTCTDVPSWKKCEMTFCCECIFKK